MRILAIRGCNLASLEGEFEIDFTAEPLRSAGIFAITGSTGSGKSTILDAVCLALFNDTPRISKAERDTIMDVGEHTVQLGDSRNILRRGTGNGYAEVDFVSLSGDTYRSRWSVRRARDKADGSIQAWNIELTNLTNGEAQQGGKTELLNKIKELIGLTFDQFTRAVMLAQGDFATFLKAGKNEKADLLEKLTGTDIYSRISKQIYDNTQGAKSDLEVVERNIEGVELLSDEQLTAYDEELQAIVAELKLLEEQEKVQTKKIEWIDAEEQLLKNVALASEQLAKSKEALDGAKPRFEHLTRVDSVQGIRDDFKSLESVRSQLDKDRATLKTQQTTQKENSEKLEHAGKDVKDKATLKKQADDTYEEAKPLIIKARDLDTQITGVAKSAAILQSEVETIKGQKVKAEGDITQSTQAITSSKETIKEFDEWFEANNHYASIVPKCDLILNFIKDAANTRHQIKSNNVQLESVEKLLATQRAKLEDEQKETERLNLLQPTEIIKLRDNLVDGEPCPVCGSVHHPISGELVDSLAQAELSKAKEHNLSLIRQLEGNIKSFEEQIISLRSIVGGYEAQSVELHTNIDGLLQSLPNWKAMFDDGTLSGNISSTSKQWLKNNDEHQKLSNSLQLKEQESKSLSERLVDIEASLIDKQSKSAEADRELHNLQSQRSDIFEGKEITAIEKQFASSCDSAAQALESANRALNALAAKAKETEGAITQITTNIEQAEAKEQALNDSVTEWLKSREDGLSMEQLAELLTNDSVWIATERRALDELKKSLTTAQTTLNERNKNHEQHKQAEIQPAEGETKELLTDIKETTTSQLAEKRERNTAINVALANNASSKERIKAYEKELEQKREVANNWEKLNGLFGSADGAKFKTMAQGYTLDVLLGYANKHLGEISDRYLLERVSPESLSLQVRDLDMLSEVRSVHSLSGGESFLISLALALGLSSLSSNRMRVESLFIDEGFGTLDGDTLRVAMDVLERLQTQGRKIGVISHVAEMTERISTQIQVVKTTNGKSHIEIR